MWFSRFGVGCGIYYNFLHTAAYCSVLHMCVFLLRRIFKIFLEYMV
jgi:hypothetical protein